jgi:hypothetical protein
MSEIRVRCKQGTLIVTDKHIRVELPPFKQQTMSRSSVTGVDSSLGTPSIFGIGGTTNLVFHGQGGEILHAGLVKTNIAKEIISLLDN